MKFYVMSFLWGVGTLCSTYKYWSLVVIKMNYFDHKQQMFPLKWDKELLYCFVVIAKDV